MQPTRNYLRFLNPNNGKPQIPLFVYLPGMDGTGGLLRSQIPYLSPPSLPTISKDLSYPHLSTFERKRTFLYREESGQWDTEGLIEGFDIRCLSIPPDDRSNWDEMVNQTLSFLQGELERGQKRPIYLCGESFGACLAMQVAMRAPELIDRVILVNPASSMRHQPLIHWGSSLTQWVPTPLYSMSVYGLLPFLGALERMDSLHRMALLDAMRSVPHGTTVWRLNLVRDFALRLNKSLLTPLKMPVLVIASGRDRLLPSITEAENLVKCLPNAQMVILPDSGHACLLETEVNLWEILQKVW
jgi:pimeloyl-ACP methyl ester carboxylesterase